MTGQAAVTFLIVGLIVWSLLGPLPGFVRAERARGDRR